jgi:hypothetical protein
MQHLVVPAQGDECPFGERTMGVMRLQKAQEDVGVEKDRPLEVTRFVEGPRLMASSKSRGVEVE